MTTVKSESTNHWPDQDCARACWSQHELPPYQDLLADTKAWLNPQPLEKWLDMGCGSGQLTRALWQLSQGRVAEIVGMDCAAVNARAYEKLRHQLRLTPRDRRLRFLLLDFSQGLPSWEHHHFDGVVSGLAIQYAESFCEETGQWTTAGYDRLLSEVRRVLRPGGRFVFSVNVPEPSWGRIAWRSLGGVFKARRPLRYLRNAWRMWRYGGWLKRESRRGRFHYLPIDTIAAKLQAAGFEHIEHKLSFAGQAYVLRCRAAAMAIRQSA